MMRQSVNMYTSYTLPPPRMSCSGSMYIAGPLLSVNRVSDTSRLVSWSASIHPPLGLTSHPPAWFSRISE